MTDTLPHIIIPPEWLRGIPDILDWQDKGGRQFPRNCGRRRPEVPLAHSLPFLNLCHILINLILEREKSTAGSITIVVLKTQYLVSFSFHLQPYIVHISLLLNQKSPSHFLTYCYPVRIALVFGIFGRLIHID